MAIAMRGTPQTAYHDTGSALSISKPSGVVSGDLIVFAVGTDSAETRTGPAGFTSKSATNVSDQRLQIWYKVADGTEGASFSCGAGGANSAGFCVAYSGVDNTTPFDVAAGTNGSGTGASITAASITPTTNGCQILFVGCRDSNSNSPQTVSPPSGSWAEQVDITVAGETCWANAYLADFNQATAGAVGTTTATASSTANATNIGILLALRPASGGGTSVSLTGQSNTSAKGTLAPSSSSALSGLAGTSAKGTLAPSSSYALTGIESTASDGTLAPSASVSMSGQAVSVSEGSVTQSFSVGLSGLEATSSAGTITASSGTVVALSGLSSTVSVGTLAPSAIVVLTGEETQALLGTMSASGPAAQAAVRTASGGGAPFMLYGEAPKKGKKEKEIRIALERAFDAFNDAPVEIKAEIKQIIAPVTLSTTANVIKADFSQLVKQNKTVKQLMDLYKAELVRMAEIAKRFDEEEQDVELLLLAA